LCAECGTAEELEPENHVWRTLRRDIDDFEWYPEESRWVPRSSEPKNTFRFNPELSLLWSEHLVSVHSIAATDLPQEVVVETSVAEVRELHGLVAHTPWGSQPVACAHTSLDYPPDCADGTPDLKARKKAFRANLAKTMIWVKGDGFAPPPGA
jgi:hypothetical protein